MNRATFWALIAAVCYGIAPIFERIGLRQAPPLAAVFVRALITVIFTAFYLAMEQQTATFGQWSVRTWVAILMSGFVGVLLAQAFYFQALKLGEAGRVVPIAGSYPLIAALLAALLLGEQLTLTRLCGTLLVLLGIILLR